ncbi:mitochondrial basic amino acids transporter [Galendromus occidentalis]|uniref:Mitochondrial basic amino acids transporter n=1 Tax=Galendromus occidentalis TaxID=34638 RepID=A0AAJ6QTV1_9ACAR|nr:mitochondrial basic amino acids transporter [Galendromus occidentalis]
MDFVAGCIGGCAGVLVGHPFDTVKVRLQTQDPRNPVYRGTFHCLRSIIAKDSVSGLFRGMSSPMVGVSVVNAIVFGVYGCTSRQFSDQDSLKTHFVAGMVAGSVQSFVTSPLELVKTRLQVQADTTPTAITQRATYAGPADCVRRIVLREGGLRALTRGLGSTLLRDGPALGAYFASYEFFTNSSMFRSDDEQNLSTSALLMAGGLAGVVSWVVSYPVDVIKSRIQSSATAKGLTQTARSMYAQEGGRSFFRGLNSALIRAYPTNAAIFFTVSFVQDLHAKYVSGKAALVKAEERIVETVQQQMHFHLHYHQLGERMHLPTISNHYH